MRFPSLAHLAAEAGTTLRRFPWTIAAGIVAAIAATTATEPGTHETAVRVAMVAALGLPATIAVSLWVGRRVGVLVAGIPVALALVLFYLAWPGIDLKHQAVRYFELSAALHLSVAFLPFVGRGESIAFWQYNRRLFLGILRSAVFSAVIFFGIAIALGALDHLFGMHVETRIYADLWLVVVFVVNTWIFLASVPTDLPALADDHEYPRALKVFTQYILTPLAFGYLIILLAYLVKIVLGAEWPSGWIGWLVASVAVTGLLGFLLVHPLRTAGGEGWIRTYSRWLFVGLIPAALMLLVAFWKRVVPYGLTEPRVLGILLGLWLLGIAVAYTLRPGISIRVIPMSLAAILLVTLYGPVSLSTISVASQRDRLATNLRAVPRTEDNLREAAASVRFLIEHGAAKAIASAVGKPLPPIRWKPVPRYAERDSIAELIMRAAGARYFEEPRGGNPGMFYASADSRAPVAVDGYAWIMRASGDDTTAHVVGGDTVIVRHDSIGNVARVRVNGDTLAFDLAPVARFASDSVSKSVLPLDRRRVEPVQATRRAALVLESISGRRVRDTLQVQRWDGWLLVGASRATDSSAALRVSRPR